MRATRARLAVLFTSAFALSACGGGGGAGASGTPGPAGSSSAGATGGGTGTTGGGTVTTSGGPVLTASTNTVSATASPTAPATVTSVQVDLSIANPPAGGLYYGTRFAGTAVAGASIVWSPSLVGGAQTGSLEITLDTPALIGSGIYHDTVTAHVCLDSGCTTEISGSPVTIAVSYTVSGNAISDATYNVLPTTIALESPSNGATLSATLNVTAYDLPPYGAYVSYASNSGGPIASLNFAQTSAAAEPYAYGTGVLTVNLKPPALLGPGSYNDSIALSICYDKACTKPAVGSPYQIPVSYTVTASAGREFQQQIVNQNLTALAVDPAGSTLYGTTAPGSSGTGSSSQLMKIDPATGTATVLLQLPSAASQIVASQDARYLYLLSEPWSAEALSPPIQVMRVRLSDLSIDQTVPLTSWLIYAAQIAVSPVDSNAWSAAFAPQGDTFNVEIFDAATARPGIWSVTSDVVYGNEALWSADGTALYVLDANLNSVAVGANGLGSGTQLQSGAAGQTGVDFGGNLQLAGGLLYGAGGTVLNPANDTILGRYVFPSDVVKAGLAADTVNNRLFAAYSTMVNNASQGTIQSFNLSTFAPIWVARLTIGTPPLRWGGNGLAWIGPGATLGVQALYLINGTFVAP